MPQFLMILTVLALLYCIYSGRPANETRQPSEHLSKIPLNLLEIHEIGSVGTSESKQQKYDQI